MERKEKKYLRGRFWRFYISSVISISLVLFIVGLFAVLYLSVSRVSAYFKENVKISVILSSQASPSQAEQFALNLEQMPQVASAELISQERGTEEMKEFLGEDFLDIFESNPIPASVNLQLKNDYFYADSIARLKAVLCEDVMVEDVIYQEGIISTINDNLKTVGLIFAGFILLLAIISIVLINNTVRLNIFSRRFSIRTMQLVGATRGVICRPFLYNSILQGAVSGVIATFALFGAWVFVSRQVPQIDLLVNKEAFLYCGAALVVLGILLCFVCTSLIVRKVTLLPVDKLYV